MAEPGAIASNNSSYFARHWRGELPLAKAFWQSGVLIGLAVIFVINTLAMEAFLLWWWLVGAVIADFVIIIWQLVGIWRSARRYTGPRYRALLARLGAVVAAMFGM